METGLDREKLLHYKAVALKHLSDPVKLRLLVACGLTFLAIVCVYTPFSDQIDGEKAMIEEERKRLNAIKGTEFLRSQAHGFRERIGKDADTNDWVQYLLGGLRQVRLKLRDMTSKEPQAVGPYRTVTLSIEVEGTYEEVIAVPLIVWAPSRRLDPTSEATGGPPDEARPPRPGACRC